jgi:RNA polymerase sigma-70 factor (ECF subfamily)
VAVDSLSAPVSGAEWAPLLEAQMVYVHRTLQRLGARPGEIDDLLQEVFLVLWRRQSHYDPRQPLRPWIFGITSRVLQENRRRRRRDPPGFIDSPEAAPSPEQQLIAAQARALVISVLERLSARHRRLLIMREIDELSVRDIADRLSVSAPTLYSRLKRARLLFTREVRRRQMAARAVALTPTIELW